MNAHQRNNAKTIATRSELSRGINGSGNPVWLVTVIDTVEWNNETFDHVNWIHYFDTEDEARNWIKWC